MLHRPRPVARPGCHATGRRRPDVAHTLRSVVVASCAVCLVGACSSPPFENPSKQGAPAGTDDAKGDERVDAAPAAAAGTAEPKGPSVAASTNDVDRTPAAVGTEAPAFRVRDDEGRWVQLSDFRGKRPVLLLFYPKDFTSGCTAELSNFAAKHDLFAKQGVAVFGVSIDPPERHHAFRESLRLPFPLLADEDGSVSAAYGALAEQGDQRFSLRKVVLVDRNGIVAYRNESYRVGDARHFDEVVEAVARLSKPAEAGERTGP
ncbi:MAG: peroxiredoxin [Deltaproteobacteria bacterium]|nr:MAG: peroxiredoxin [Deltaproteobacteria bacterium]